MFALLLVLLDESHTTEAKIEVGGLTRAYRLHVPPGHDKAKPVALVIELHGGGGNAKQAERHGGWSELSDKEGFLVAYPDAVEGNWNDGRGEESMRSHREKIDDVAFVSAMIDAIAKGHGVDPGRVYATGLSNGGMMSHRLGMELAGRIAAIAPVVGGIPEAIAEGFKPARPVSVMVIQGTEDPLVPYGGGAVKARNRTKPTVSTDEAVRLWVAHNGGGAPVEEAIPDKDPDDGCTAVRTTWKGKEADVVLIKVTGGGHNRPGGRQYLPVRLIGKTCRDFDSTPAVWEFFKEVRSP